MISLFKRETNFVFTSKESKSATVLISVFNEEITIEDRIKNLSETEYDFGLLEVLVGSDGSFDRTVEILDRIKQNYKWLKVFAYSSRRGKAAVLNDLVKHAKNEILIFTDANTVFEKDTINQLVLPFSNEEIGGVCGRLNLTDNKYKTSGTTDEVSYWRYETFIKQAEGDCNVLIGANGGNYAIRKFLYTELPLDKPVTDDFFITMSLLAKNYKFIYNNFAVAYEEVSPNILDEFRRKVRFSATNFQSLVLLKRLVFSKNLLLTFSFWSHKILRWIIPFVLITMFFSNYLIIINNGSDFYLYTFYTQLFLFAIAIIGFIVAMFKIRIPVISLFYFFILTNISIVIGFIKFLRGRHTSYWQSTPR